MSQLMDKGRRVDTALPGPQQGYQQPSFSQAGETQVEKMSIGGKLSGSVRFQVWPSAEQNTIAR